MELPRNQRAIDATQPGSRRLRYRIKGVPGLHLEVHATGRRVWQVRYQMGKGRARRTQRWVSIGLADDVTLARAIAKTQEIRASAVLEGKDELVARREAASPQSLDWLFEQWAARHGRKTAGFAETERIWGKDVSPRIGALIAREVTRQDVAKLRDDIGRRSAPMGDRAAALIGRVFNWAVDAGHLAAHPATRLRRISRNGRGGRVLSMEELRIFLTRLPASRLHDHTKTILLLLALLGQRRTEVAHMAAGEVRGDTWTIPKTRTKNGREHVVPLPPWAAGVVMSARTDLKPDKVRSNGLLFASRRGPSSPRAVTRAMLRATAELGIGPFSPHDLRRTVATGMAELQVPEEVRERVLNHTSKSVEGRHYNRHEYTAEKYRALSLWEDAVRLSLRDGR